MSSDKMPGKTSHHMTKPLLMVGILALGILASIVIGSQMMHSASGQTGGSGTTTSTSDGAGGQQVTSTNDNSNNSPGNRTFSAASTVSTTGMATTKIKPDKVSVIMGVETNTTSAAKDAVDANAKNMANVIAALKKIGVADEQISTTSYNLQPVYANKLLENSTSASSSEGATGGGIGASQPTSDKICIQIYPPPPGCQVNQVIVGYKAMSSITIELAVNGTIEAGSAIDAAVGAGANTVNGVTFFVSQQSQQDTRDSLIRDAIANARHRADIAAGAVGMHVSGVRSIDLGDVQFPIYARSPEAVSTSAGAGTSLLPGMQEVSASVSITFYLASGNATGTSSAATAGEVTSSSNATTATTTGIGGVK